MDFESPDVEKDFPGLYASEGIKNCNESDFSDDNHEKAFKKDLIIGKRKEKKDSKKDRGYATLEGESSPDEDIDSRSPCKSKKSKAFKFPTKKSEKREKSREKEMEKKEKEIKKERDKKEKEKVKSKDKKKIMANDESSEANDYHIFGVDLSTAVERSGCLDGVLIPIIVRNCIDCIHSFGLTLDGLYKISGIKSKVQFLRKAYNARESVFMGENDVPLATCLLKMFLRELPEPILTSDLLARFEEAGAIMEVDVREKELQNLITYLPAENRVLLGWLIVHFDTVTMHEKQNKLNAQSIAMTFSPVLQMSHRLLTAFLCHCKALFGNVKIERYVPPLCPGSSFPEKPDEIATELKKQELLLNQIHREMSEGFVSKKKEEQLWEVQRIVTQLKRKLKGLQRFQDATIIHKSLEEDQSLNEETLCEPKKPLLEAEDCQIKQKDTPETFKEINKIEEVVLSNVENRSITVETENLNETENLLGKFSSEKQDLTDPVVKVFEVLKGYVKSEELLKFQNSLQDRINQEKELIIRLNTEIQNFGDCSNAASPSESNDCIKANVTPDPDINLEKLSKDSQILKKKVENLNSKIFEERLACVELKVCINILEMLEKYG